MQSTFLLSCKYGKLAETTEWDKSLGERKIERTRKQLHWRGKKVRWGESGKRVHRITKHYFSAHDMPDWRGRGHVMGTWEGGVGVSLCVEEWRRNGVNVDYSWESGRIQGLAGQTLLTHWDQRWDCFHWKEFQEWARRAISDFTQRALTTVLIQSRAHTLSHTFKDTVSHANNGVRDTLRSPVSPSSLEYSSYHLQNECCHLWPPAECLGKRSTAMAVSHD